MEKQDFGYGEDVNDEEANLIFANVAKKYIDSLNLLPFDSEGLELVRSESEVSKCKMLRDKLLERNIKIEERKKNGKQIEKKTEGKRNKKEGLIKAKKMFKKSNSTEGNKSKGKGFKKRR